MSHDKKLNVFTSVNYFNNRTKGRQDTGYGDNNIMRRHYEYVYGVTQGGLAIHATPVKTRDFEWNTSLTLASNKNKVKSLTDGVDYYRITSAPFVAEIGAKVGEEYGVITFGLAEDLCCAFDDIRRVEVYPLRI